MKGWKLVPVELTAENGMKAALMGEFRLRVLESGEDGNERMREVTVPWDTIKQIHRAVVAAAPTPPAQKLEGKVYQLYEWDRWNDCSESAFHNYKDDGMKTRILYIYTDTPTPQYMEEQPVGKIIPCNEPPAQDDEPVAEVRLEQGERVIDLTRIMELPEGTKLYTRPDDKLRKAAEGAAAEWRKGFLSGEGLALKVIDALEK